MLKIDTPDRRIHVRRLESGSEYWKPYDQLMIATGARPICPELPGIDEGGIFGVNGLQSAIEILKALDLTNVKWTAIHLKRIANKDRTRQEPIQYKE